MISNEDFESLVQDSARELLDDADTYFAEWRIARNNKPAVQGSSDYAPASGFGIGILFETADLITYTLQFVDLEIKTHVGNITDAVIATSVASWIDQGIKKWTEKPNKSLSPEEVEKIKQILEAKVPTMTQKEPPADGAETDKGDGI